jgi:hypothetical protein
MKSPLLLVLLLLAPVVPAQRAGVSPTSKPGTSAETIYRNAAFGFRYRIPYGWVERTKEMQEGNDSAKGEVLLAVFERPPQAAGDSINSAAVIAAESAANYPGLKEAEDYLGPLTELTTSKGFKADGEPSEVQIDSQRLVRIDFTKALSEKVVMHQSTLVLLVKGQIVSFTFVADSADAVDGLIDHVSFSVPKSKAK